MNPKNDLESLLEFMDILKKEGFGIKMLDDESFDKIVKERIEENDGTLELPKNIVLDEKAQEEIIELLGILEVYIEDEGLEILKELNKYFL